MRRRGLKMRPERDPGSGARKASYNLTGTLCFILRVMGSSWQILNEEVTFCDWGFEGSPWHSMEKRAWGVGTGRGGKPSGWLVH